MKILRWLKRLFRARWVVCRTIWPYRDGYGTYCPRTKTISESGLTKEQAIQRRDELNA